MLDAFDAVLNDLGQRTALHGDIPVGDTSVRVFSIHFENNDALGELRTTQLRETLDAAQRLACERPSIVAGDFNTWYDTAPELYVAERAGYTDAVKVAGDTCKQCHKNDGLADMDKYMPGTGKTADNLFVRTHSFSKEQARKSGPVASGQPVLQSGGK